MCPSSTTSSLPSTGWADVQLRESATPYLRWSRFAVHISRRRSSDGRRSLGGQICAGRGGPRLASGNPGGCRRRLAGSQLLRAGRRCPSPCRATHRPRTRSRRSGGHLLHQPARMESCRPGLRQCRPGFRPAVPVEFRSIRPGTSSPTRAASSPLSTARQRWTRLPPSATRSPTSTRVVTFEHRPRQPTRPPSRRNSPQPLPISAPWTLAWRRQLRPTSRRSSTPLAPPVSPRA